MTIERMLELILLELYKEEKNIYKAIYEKRRKELKDEFLKLYVIN